METDSKHVSDVFEELTLDTTKLNIYKAFLSCRTKTFYSRSKDQNARYLSNFTVLNKPLNINGLYYNSIENYYQDQKFKSSFGDKSKLPDFTIKGKLTPKQAKSFGSKGGMRKFGFKLNNNLWSKKRIYVMVEAIFYRFLQDKKFKSIVEMYIKEKIILIHFERGKNPFWGAYIRKDGIYIGQNVLGDIIMETFKTLF